ncbi:MAG: HAD-IB family phosphatase [Ignavibacteria bacterium]|nr:HAD-IB family phosphatase [Ignavibacteria bacterium]
MDKSKLKIYSDFDGTITIYDVWMELGEYFIKDKETWAGTIKQFESQEISTRECFIKECGLMKDFNLEKFNEIIDKQKIDPTFPDFYKFCRQHNIPLMVLSEGMDYYIGRILKNYNFDIPYYANRIVISEDKSSFALDFPYSDSDCIKCGTSKRNIMLNNTGDDEISVFIGDGFSDTCAVNYADIVFAKKSLASYCWKNNITYFDYQTFGDVKKKLEKILNKKLKHRQIAGIKRREVFLRG